jgi:hypothetical protein
VGEHPNKRAKSQCHKNRDAGFGCGLKSVSHFFPFTSATVEALAASVADLAGGISKTAKNRSLVGAKARARELWAGKSVLNWGLEYQRRAKAKSGNREISFELLFEMSEKQRIFHQFKTEMPSCAVYLLTA